MHKFSSVIIIFLTLSFNAELSANGSFPTILILGDSLSAAYNIPVATSWPQLFAEKIKSISPQTQVINASISGETTYGGQQRLARLLEQHNPSHLIIELGGNDGLRGLNFKQTTENFRQMIALSESRQLSVLLIGVRMPPNLGPLYNNRFQQIFETIVDEFSVDYLPRFLEGIAAADAKYMQADGIHPTQLAQPLLAEKVFQQMQIILAR
ncbi:MAG: acyl-CoA thioesterase-1 [Planctomycetota bacterium]|jgi:acyl-CoA thioesterase-1